MKVKAVQKFKDKEASEKAGKPVRRKVGEEFTVNKERFAEINAAHKDDAGNPIILVEEVKE